MRPPRELLILPHAFGEQDARLSAEASGAAAGRAALVQSQAMAAVRVAMRGRRVSGAEVADVLELDLLLLPGPPAATGKRTVVRLRDLG